MRSWIIVILLILSRPALATVGGPNSFTVLGFDQKTRLLYLKEEVGGESGEYQIWVLDYTKRSDPKITRFSYGDQDNGMDLIPKGLEAAPVLPFLEAKISGEIIKQGLEAIEERLIARYDLKVSISWKGAKASTPLVAYYTPAARLVESYLIDDRCALAIVASLGRPYETGYEEQKPVLVCKK